MRIAFIIIGVASMIVGFILFWVGYSGLSNYSYFSWVNTQSFLTIALIGGGAVIIGLVSCIYGVVKEKYRSLPPPP